MYLNPLNNFIVLFQTLILLIFAYVISSPWFPVKNQTKISLGYYNETLLNFTELTGRYGYISEEHHVVTDDGYILTMFRILKAKNCKGKTRSPPVLLMHGLLQSSDSWVDSGPDSGLAYLIADACYDIWVGNVRGNYYSRHHVYLDPDKDSEFWNFDIEKIGTYDIPATIDYVLNYTKTKKLNYIGFSQGAGTFFVMCSERPGFCHKAQLVIGLAPATRHTNTKSIIFRGVPLILAKTETVLSRFGVQQVFSKSSLFQEFMAFFCQLTDVTTSICKFLIAFLDHVHTFSLESISDPTVKVLFGHFTAGTSLHNMARYGQSMISSRFQKFDYGKEKNLALYGSERPPVYNVSTVTVPVACIYGENDGIVDPEDVKWIVSKLPNVIDLYKVEDPMWTHLDFTYSRYTKKMVFTKLNKYLLKNSVT